MINGLDKLPIKELERIGFKERDLIHNRTLLVGLLSGKRSDLVPISFKDNEGKVQKQSVKLSLSNILRQDGTYGLNIHPIKEKFEKAEHLTTNQYNKLNNGGTVVKDMVDNKGNLSAHILQKDKQTNELLKVSVNDLNFPLNKMELEQVKKSQPIKVNGSYIEIDLSSSKGFNKKDKKNDLSKIQSLNESDKDLAKSAVVGSENIENGPSEEINPTPRKTVINEVIAKQEKTQKGQKEKAVAAIAGGEAIDSKFNNPKQENWGKPGENVNPKQDFTINSEKNEAIREVHNLKGLSKEDHTFLKAVVDAKNIEEVRNAKRDYLVSLKGVSNVKHESNGNYNGQNSKIMRKTINFQGVDIKVSELIEKAIQENSLEHLDRQKGNLSPSKELEFLNNRSLEMNPDHKKNALTEKLALLPVIGGKFLEEARKDYRINEEQLSGVKYIALHNNLNGYGFKVAPNKPNYSETGGESRKVSSYAPELDLDKKYTPRKKQFSEDVLFEYQDRKNGVVSNKEGAQKIQQKYKQLAILDAEIKKAKPEQKAGMEDLKDELVQSIRKSLNDRPKYKVEGTEKDKKYTLLADNNADKGTGQKSGDNGNVRNQANQRSQNNGYQV
tara:strand:- start:39471 stop:41306 length:1836 start_codon:yes stop_codon:yes gene_type:complete